MKNLFLILSFLLFIPLLSGYAQEAKKIDYTSDRQVKNEEKYPGAIILSKVEDQVHFTHQGIEVWCDNAVFYNEANFFKAFGNVRMKQGDTVSMSSKYAEYNGTTQFAFASGDVVMKRPQTTLLTDTLFFDRMKQQAYYRSGGKVIDTAYVLTSRIGRYYMADDKYSFVSKVVITNPEYEITSTQMDMYSETGHAFFYGPTVIKGETSTVYCERGFYDTRADMGYFVKNSRIDYENRIVEGDSLYFDRSRNFASATNNIKVTDTINHSVVTGHYAEVFRDRDSVIITKRPVAATLQDQDSVFIHSDTLMITGKPDKRIIRGFYDVRLFKTNMSGKSDSIYVDQETGLTKLINLNSGPVTSISKRRSPVLWSGESQMTGDTIHLKSNPETEKLDSLLVFNNAFLIQKDTIEGYNQVKGMELVGLFRDNEIYQVDINKNTETLNYMRNDEQELIGINRAVSSSIRILLNNRKIEDIYYFTNPEGSTTPEEDFPVNERELNGFNWRGEERLMTKEDLFAGQPLPQLVKIEGIPLPEEQEEFFDEREEDLLLNENSRLSPEDLQNEKPQDSTKSGLEEEIQQNLKNSRDTVPSSRDSLQVNKAAAQLLQSATKNEDED
ncbi:OstA-like protein [Zunongwangia sp. H14]|uniref:OstA-like protein n=1 Tax=Zunongwangia sp. H14 TaxID=3240792 RepID=UPI00356475B3